MCSSKFVSTGAESEAAARRIALSIGPEQWAEKGRLLPDYSEACATEHLKGDEVTPRAHVGDGEATIWTCDLWVAICSYAATGS